ncbi:MAG TPA: porin family protein [Nitrospiria bacterium]|nr:porin family protein [Nitrospiria bacterium]
MKNEIAAIVVCFAGLFASSMAMEAKAADFYVGAGLGQSQTSLSVPLNKNTDTAFNLTGGVQINPNFSTEIEYINLGKVVLGSGSGNSDGWAAALVGILPMRGNVSLFGKFGLARINTTWDSASSVTPGSQTETGLTWGLGGQLDFSRRNGVRLSYDTYQIGTTDPATGTSQTITLSLLYRF